jgi:hypothetical protein
MAGHVECSGQNTNAYRIMVRKNQGQTNFEDVRADGRIILNLILRKQYGRSWTRFFWVRIEASIVLI